MNCIKIFVEVQQTFSYMRVTCFDLAMELLEVQERIRLSHQFNAQKIFILRYELWRDINDQTFVQLVIHKIYMLTCIFNIGMVTCNLHAVMYIKCFFCVCNTSHM